MTAKRNATLLVWMHELWPIVAPPTGQNCSVLAARVAIDVGRQLGAAYQAIPVDLVVMNSRAVDLIDLKIPPDQWDSFAATIGSECENEIGSGGGWPGHMIIGTDELICDLTAHVFDRPDKKIRVTPWILPRPPRTYAEWWYDMPHDDGTKTVMRIRPRPDIKAFRRSQEWQSDFKLYSDRIVRMIVDAENRAQQIMADNNIEGNVVVEP